MDRIEPTKRSRSHQNVAEVVPIGSTVHALVAQFLQDFPELQIGNTSTNVADMERMACVLADDIYEMVTKCGMFDLYIDTTKMDRLPEVDLDEIRA